MQIGTAYYLSPDGPAAQKPYVLLRKALERSSRVAVARYSMRDRERLGLLRVVGDVIALHQMRWPDEIRPTSAVPAPADVDVTDGEIDAAAELASVWRQAGSSCRSSATPTAMLSRRLLPRRRRAR
ncbi:Ku protein [Streptomyces lavendulae]|uniref:Ku protein n=1 Tax=Streptomyces lavendulae TaxID=1914 RepID=UPI003323119A